MKTNFLIIEKIKQNLVMFLFVVFTLKNRATFLCTHARMENFLQDYNVCHIFYALSYPLLNCNCLLLLLLLLQLLFSGI